MEALAPALRSVPAQREASRRGDASSELSLKDRAFMHAVISRDGSPVAYNANQALDIYAARVVPNPSPHMLVREAKGLVWDRSRDNKRLLFSKAIMKPSMRSRWPPVTNRCS